MPVSGTKFFTALKNIHFTRTKVPHTFIGDRTIALGERKLYQVLHNNSGDVISSFIHNPLTGKDIQRNYNGGWLTIFPFPMKDLKSKIVKLGDIITSMVERNRDGYLSNKMKFNPKTGIKRETTYVTTSLRGGVKSTYKRSKGDIVLEEKRYDYDKGLFDNGLNYHMKYNPQTDKTTTVTYKKHETGAKIKYLKTVDIGGKEVSRKYYS